MARLINKTKLELHQENIELREMLAKTSRGQDIAGETTALRRKLEEAQDKYTKAMNANSRLREAAGVSIRMFNEAIRMLDQPDNYGPGEINVLRKSFRAAKNKLQEAIIT